ncbi:hypothetical protein [Bartonella koehlerae]|uniref:hypothetical protein n=1 Tax=Bartonella koehlerae TaxID=92181 RepID=UPI00068AE5DA|nr:hypothetical protein [Bartonella koehlerae]
MSSAVLHGLTNASTLYEALSSFPNNAYQPYLCLEIPLKKLLKRALLQENHLEKFFTKNKKTPFMKTTKTDPSLLRKEKSTKIRIGTSKNTHEFEGSLFPRSMLEISKEYARGNIS